MAQGTKPESERFPLGEPLVLRFDGKEVVGTLFNLSMTGMFIATENTYAAGTDFTFLGHLDEAGATIQGSAKVAWRRREGSSSSRPAGMGAIFQRLDSNSRRAVRQLIENRQAESARPVRQLDDKPIDFTTAMIETLPSRDSSQFTPPPSDDIFRAAAAQRKATRDRRFLGIAVVFVALLAAGWLAMRLTGSMPGRGGADASKDPNVSSSRTESSAGADDSGSSPPNSNNSGASNSGADERESLGERPAANTQQTTVSGPNLATPSAKAVEPADGAPNASDGASSNPGSGSDNGTPDVAAAAAADPGTTPAADPPAFDATEVRSAVQRWAQAWSSQNVAAYIDAYADGFRPQGGTSRRTWAEQRQDRVGGPSFISVKLAGLQVEPRGDRRARASFVQAYKSDRLEDVVFKTLELVRENGSWKILDESSRPATESELASTSPGG